MKVHEFIKLLQEFEDQDADITVVEHSSGGGYYDQGGNCKETPFNKEDHLDYVDMRGNPHTPKDAPYYNSRTLLIGIMDK